MTPTEIELFIDSKLSLNNPQPKRFPIEVIQYLTEDEQPTNKHLTNCLWLIKHNLSTNPICKFGGCSNTREFISFNKGHKLGCCANHTRKITLLETYGVENISHLSDIKNKISIKNKACARKSLEKRINTTLGKYGCVNVFQADGTKDKIIDTNMRKYGVKSFTQSSQYNSIMKEVIFKKYGVDHISKVQEVRDKISKGVKSSADVAKIKRVQTCLDLYGVKNPTQSPEILEKAQKSSFRRKEYKWKSGEISLVQGYEPIVLKELEEEGYKFSDVLTSPKDMPTIGYIFEEIEHRYYPDIYIPKDNKIIEVKSEYTLNLELEKNQAKFEATRNLGFDFSLEVR